MESASFILPSIGKVQMHCDSFCTRTKTHTNTHLQDILKESGIDLGAIKRGPLLSAAPRLPKPLDTALLIRLTSIIDQLLITILHTLFTTQAFFEKMASHYLDTE